MTIKGRPVARMVVVLCIFVYCWRHMWGTVHVCKLVCALWKKHTRLCTIIYAVAVNEYQWVSSPVNYLCWLKWWLEWIVVLWEVLPFFFFFSIEENPHVYISQYICGNRKSICKTLCSVMPWNQTHCRVVMN